MLPRDLWHFNPYTDILAPLRAPTFPYMVRLRPHVEMGRRRETRYGTENGETGLRLGSDDFSAQQSCGSLGQCGAQVLIRTIRRDR